LKEEVNPTMQKRLLSMVVLGIIYAACMGGPVHAQTGFSLSSIKGQYGFSFFIFTITDSGLLPTGGTGVYTADGEGQLTGSETFSSNGQICAASLSGTYTVNPDGTGTTTVEFSPITEDCSGGTFHQSLVITDSGNTVRVASTDPGVVTVLEEWKKQGRP
jgi:hypothetical protein